MLKLNAVLSLNNKKNRLTCSKNNNNNKILMFHLRLIQILYLGVFSLAACYLLIRNKEC